MITKMDEKKFWGLVELADWPNKGYKNPKMVYRKLLSEEESKIFHSAVSEAYCQLDEVATDMDLGVGDDSYCDLLHHIIGLGKAQFEKHLKNPKLIVKRADNSEYEESFTYCLPYDSDYEEGKSEYSIENVIKVAKEGVKEIEKFQKMDKDGTHLAPIHNEMHMVVDILRKFLDHPDQSGLDGLAANIKILESIGDIIDKFFQKNAMELPRKFTENNMNGMCTALFSNAAIDAKSVLDYQAIKV